ncbi:MAG: division/cell wall cluster transcriptional repressor MraZ [Pseudomonadota bacterium]|jgi:MraZ protein|uniref:Transcriptional regulator MraZ n=2 Tax=Alteromonas TaxID=226 RepID=A0A2S9VBJ3_9ALTE|nr:MULTISPECIES: division/cell wall cluster transcriptional repressor MraZ [Alteromonas]MAD09586.1 cell division/cell wall cluster transcriptional repressor MraZ [Alteromonas sp.]MAJ68625.1 cell division/cell wall cluster transcriptional repressor MraZ [Alteromonadaceae bacterium]MBR9790668.1 division/cell wall cluster transcriptional repressor MraZ [Gammaproteobacteria bacterium]MDG6098285.1 division/cell wall cluster transcriptional repressor MraZ [Alteromonas sp. ZYF713]MDY6925534.1 divisio|tara:strand:- start:10112 stop:10570 length:459 start_codon:yes stop_codon:yes gene_type:complete
MFRGANAINLDSKGRLAIPTKHRQPLLDDCAGQLICTIDTQQSCLLLYPLPEWEEIELKLSKFSSNIEQERRKIRLLLGYAIDCEMDKSGRVLIPVPLRNHAKLDKEILLVGQLNKFEIWNSEIWAKRIEEDMEVERSGNFELTERLQDFSL